MLLCCQVEVDWDLEQSVSFCDCVESWQYPALCLFVFESTRTCLRSHWTWHRREHSAEGYCAVPLLCRHCLMCLWKVHRQLYVCWTLSLSIHWKHICALSKTVANLCHVVDINYTANVVQLVGYLSFFFLLYFLSIFIGYFMILQSLD